MCEAAEGFRQPQSPKKTFESKIYSKGPKVKKEIQSASVVLELEATGVG